MYVDDVEMTGTLHQDDGIATAPNIHSPLPVQPSTQHRQHTQQQQNRRAERSTMASEIDRATPPEAAPAARAMNAEPEQADDFLLIVSRARAENERCKTRPCETTQEDPGPRSELSHHHEHYEHRLHHLHQPSAATPPKRKTEGLSSIDLVLHLFLASSASVSRADGRGARATPAAWTAGLHDAADGTAHEGMK